MSSVQFSSSLSLTFPSVGFFSGGTNSNETVLDDGIIVYNSSCPPRIRIPPFDMTIPP